MNIPGPGMRPDSRADIRTQNGANRLTDNAPASALQKNAAGEAAFFMRGGTELSASVRATLEAELAALGIPRAEQTPDILIRAMILKQHDIQLSQPLLRESTGDAGLSAKAEAFRLEIISALDNPRLPAQVRIALIEFLGRTDALYTRPTDIVFTQESAEALIELKTVILERFFRLAVDNPGSIPEFLIEGASESRITFELAAGIRSEGSAGRILSGSPEGAALNDFRIALGELLREGTLDRPGFDRLLSQLTERLQAAVDNVSTPAGGRLSVTLAGVLAGFIRESVDDLKARLTSLFFSDEHTLALSGGTFTPGLRTLMRRSGFGFEWRLLLWYRTGRDPDRLHALVRDDYKMMLMQLTSRLRQETGSAAGRLDRLEQQAQELLDSITRGQLDLVLADGKVSREAWMAAQLAPSGQETLRLRVNHDGESDDTDTATGTPIVFSVNTAGLGTVQVEMRHWGSRLSLEMNMPDERLKEYIAREAGVLRDALTGKGYEVSSIVFTTSDRGNRGDNRP